MWNNSHVTYVVCAKQAIVPIPNIKMKRTKRHLSNVCATTRHSSSLEYPAMPPQSLLQSPPQPTRPFCCVSSSFTAFCSCLISLATLFLLHIFPFGKLSCTTPGTASECFSLTLSYASLTNLWESSFCFRNTPPPFSIDFSFDCSCVMVCRSKRMPTRYDKLSKMYLNEIPNSHRTIANISGLLEP